VSIVHSPLLIPLSWKRRERFGPSPGQFRILSGMTPEQFNYEVTHSMLYYCFRNNTSTNMTSAITHGCMDVDLTHNYSEDDDGPTPIDDDLIAPGTLLVPTREFAVSASRQYKLTSSPVVVLWTYWIRSQVMERLVSTIHIVGIDHEGEQVEFCWLPNHTAEVFKLYFNIE